MQLKISTKISLVVEFIGYTICIKSYVLTLLRPLYTKENIMQLKLKQGSNIYAAFQLIASLYSAFFFNPCFFQFVLELLFYYVTVSYLYLWHSEHIPYQEWSIYAHGQPGPSSSHYTSSSSADKLDLINRSNKCSVVGYPSIFPFWQQESLPILLHHIHLIHYTM